MPHSRPMPTIGRACHELRLEDAAKEWRIFYYVDDDAIVILEVFNKTTRQTPDHVLDTCRNRLASYKKAIRGKKKREKP
jgi:phage-related protein